jgi:hypothetical protein
MYKIGDVILLNEPFKISKINTWLNPFVKFFINLWHKVNKTAYVDYSHVGIVAMYEGKLHLWESVKDGFLPTELIETRLSGVDHLILRPHFPINTDAINNICAEIYATEYDYEGVTISQLFHQVTNRLVWLKIGQQNYSKKLYCVESVCYIYNRIDYNLFPEWWAVDQKDLYFSKYFQHINNTTK